MEKNDVSSWDKSLDLGSTIQDEIFNLLNVIVVTWLHNNYFIPG